EEAHGRAVFRSHVATRGAVGEAKTAQALAVELHEFIHHTLLTKELGDGTDEVGGGCPFAQASLQLETHHLRHQHVDWLPRIAASASLPPPPQPNTPTPLIMVVWLSVPTSVSGMATCEPSSPMR